MKNHKGQVATLLTLGLVVVGTLITLGTSLFVNNKKTNLASNSRASGCSAGVSIGGGYYKCGANCGATSSGICPNYSHNSKDANCAKCGGAAEPLPAEEPATTLNPGTGCKGYNIASEECDSPTTTGCNRVNGVQYYKCVETVASVPATLPDCGMTVSFASQDCAYGIDETGCKSGTAKCKPKPAAAQPAAQPAETKYSCCKVYANSSTCDGKKRIQNQGNAFVTTCAHNNFVDCSSVNGPTTSGASICPDATAATVNTTYTAAGGTVASTGQSCCFKKNGKVYVYSSYQSMVNNGMLDSSGNPDCGRQSAAVVKSYGADASAGCFVCPGGATNMMSETEYTNLVNTVTLRLCKDGKAGTCLFGNADSSTGPAKCSSGLQESGIKGCKGVTASNCSDLTNIDTCVAAQRAGKNCAWDQSSNKCIIPGTNAPAAGSDTCTQHLGFNCSSGGYTGSTKTFNYYKSTAKGCESNTVGGSCYGTTSTSCSTEWNAFLKSQCDGVGAPAGNTNNCIQQKCKDLDTRNSEKVYYEKSGVQYANCANNTFTNPIGDLTMYCGSQTVGIQATSDNTCKQQSGDPLSYCPSVPLAQNFPCIAGFEKSNSAKCGLTNKACCVQEKTAVKCVKKNCQTLNPEYAFKAYYENNGTAYSTEDMTSCQNNVTSAAITNLPLYCGQAFGVQASADNSCKQQTNDPFAYCNNKLPFGLNTPLTKNMPCKDGYEHSSARCGFPSTVCCTQKQQQVPIDTVIPLAGDCFDQNGQTYCPVI